MLISRPSPPQSLRSGQFYGVCRAGLIRSTIHNEPPGFSRLSGTVTAGLACKPRTGGDMSMTTIFEMPSVSKPFPWSVAAADIRSSQTKISSGRKADTMAFGASTTSLMRRSTATAQIA